MIESHEHPHVPKTGLPWLDILVASCALIVSVASLTVAVLHGRTMEKLVEATSWPYLDFSHSNYDEVRNVDVISFLISNNGVGPARLESFELSLDGKPLKGMVDLLVACCNVDMSQIRTREDFQARIGFEITSPAAPNLIPARDKLLLLQFPKQGANPAIYEALDKARFRLKARACYCSVFNECWVTDLRLLRPEKVTKCTTEGTVQYLE